MGLRPRTRLRCGGGPPASGGGSAPLGFCPQLALPLGVAASSPFRFEEGDGGAAAAGPPVEFIELLVQVRVGGRRPCCGPGAGCHLVSTFARGGGGGGGCFPPPGGGGARPTNASVPRRRLPQQTPVTKCPTRANINGPTGCAHFPRHSFGHQPFGQQTHASTGPASPRPGFAAANRCSCFPRPPAAAATHVGAAGTPGCVLLGWLPQYMVP